MTCAFCKTHWCWLCGTLTNKYTYLHFMPANPFGCVVVGSIEKVDKNFFGQAFLLWLLSPLVLLQSCILMGLVGNVVLFFQIEKKYYKEGMKERRKKTWFPWVMVLLYFLTLPISLLVSLGIFLVTLIPIIVY